MSSLCSIATNILGLFDEMTSCYSGLRFLPVSANCNKSKKRGELHKGACIEETNPPLKIVPLRKASGVHKASIGK